MFNRRRAVVLAVLLLVCSGPARALELESSLHEAVVSVPLAAGANPEALVATLYRPDGNGPFPLLVLSHGSPADGAARARMGRYRVIPRIREFTQRGFAVMVPMRRGYGDTGGDWAERYGPCANPDFQAAGRAAAEDLLASIAYAASLPIWTAEFDRFLQETGFPLG